MPAKSATLPMEPVIDRGSVKDVQLVSKDEALPAPSIDLMQMFDRWVSDPNASVEKVERLMALWERSEAKKAEAAFNAAMAAAQAEIRPIAADAYNPQTRSKYASYEALDAALRPIYTRHGFALSFNTGDAPEPLMVRVLCDVSHIGGFSKPYRADMPADGKGAKGGDVMTRTHATGSAMSYGQRYLLKLIFNVAVGEGDDDGNRAGRVLNDKEAPPKFDDWWTDMVATADHGITALEAAWKDSPKAFKAYAQTHRRQEWADLKKKAERTAAS